MTKFIWRYRRVLMYVMILLPLLLIGLYFWQVYPLGKQITYKEQESLSLLQEIGELELSREQNNVVRIANDSLQEKLKQIPTSSHIDELLMEVNREAKAHLLTLEQLYVQVLPYQGRDRNSFISLIAPYLEQRKLDVDKLELSFVRIELEWKGEEGIISNYIASLRQLERILHVEKLSFVREEDTTIQRGKITLYAFYVHPDVERLD